MRGRFGQFIIIIICSLPEIAPHPRLIDFVIMLMGKVKREMANATSHVKSTMNLKGTGKGENNRAYPSYMS